MCSYYKKLNHDEHKFLKRQIDHLSHLLEKNNIKVLDSIRSSSSQESSKDVSKGKGKGKALVFIASKLDS